MECHGIQKYLGEGAQRVHVLQGVDLELYKGQVAAIVGPSGCGKSTLLYLLGMLDRQDGGTISINGERVPLDRDGVHARMRNESIGFIFQFHFLLPEFTALENVIMPMRKLNRLTLAQMKERAQSLLAEVGLGEKLHRLPSQLSGGEQQRVAIARALANEPRVLLADEPTGNLDVANSHMAFDVLMSLAHKKGQAVLVVTHNPDLAAKCDRVLHMNDGRFSE